MTKLISIKASTAIHLLILVPLLVSAFGGSDVYAADQGQTSSAEDHALALLETLTPEEKVGQLFLVTFNGTDVDFETQIFDLITNHHIGGVLLQGQNDNFLAAPQTVNGTWQLARALQTAEWSASQSNQIEPETNDEFRPAFIQCSPGNDVTCQRLERAARIILGQVQSFGGAGLVLHMSISFALDFNPNGTFQSGF